MKRYSAYLFVLPSLAILIFLIGWPLIYAVRLSLNEVTLAAGGMEYTYVGAKNYTMLVRDPQFQQAFKQTIMFMVAQVGIGLSISLMIAITLNHHTKGVGILSRIFVLPFAMSYVVNALVWQRILNGSNGVFNIALQNAGLIDDKIVWLAHPTYAPMVIIGATIWKETPIAALILLAALKTVPGDLLDAAKVDGAGAIDRFRYVTFPWIRRIFLVALVMATVSALKLFDLIWVLTGGGPVDRTVVLNVFLFRSAFMYFRLGYAAAASFVIVALVAGLIVVYVKVLGGISDD